MNKSLWLSAVLILALLLSGGCGPAAQPSVSPSPPGEVKAPAEKAATAVPKAAWERQWDSTMAEARKEGQLAIYGSVSDSLRGIGLDKTLNQKFGLTVEFTGGKASEIIPKLVAERKAGRYSGDIFILSPTTLVNTLKPGGLTEAIDQMIFLPDVLDPKAWYQNDLPWVDKGHHQIAMLAMPVAPVVINTDLAKPEEIRSYRDLLNPKWKGRIVLVDPTGAGAGNDWFSGMAEGVMDVNYLREFAKQEPIISRDSRIMAEWVARGKYPITVGLKTDIVAEFQRLGSPIQLVTPVEGTYVGTDSGGLTLLKNPEHPNAAKLFINWILTKEGLAFISKAYGGQTARTDVATDFIDPKQVRQPGAKYLNTNTEEYASKLPGYFKLAAEVFAGSLK